MSIARSTYYRDPAQRLDEAELLVAITAISDEFEAYGWRRVRAALQHQGVILNHKRIKRLMREPTCSPAVADVTSRLLTAQDLPIFPDLGQICRAELPGSALGR